MTFGKKFNSQTYNCGTEDEEKKSTFFTLKKMLLLELNEILEKLRYFYTEHASRSCLHIYQLKFSYYYPVISWPEC